jgi:hypothetical protein
MHRDFRIALHHHRILKGDQVLALDVHQLPPHLLGFLQFGEAHHHQAAHHQDPDTLAEAR